MYVDFIQIKKPHNQIFTKWYNIINFCQVYVGVLFVCLKKIGFLQFLCAVSKPYHFIIIIIICNDLFKYITAMKTRTDCNISVYFH